MKFPRWLIVFFIIITLVTIFIYITTFSKGHETLYSSPIAPIEVGTEGGIHFFKNGFAISHTDTKFYTFDGEEMGLPFTQQDLEDMENMPIINRSTNGYMLINNRFLYDSSDIPFRLIHKIEEDKEGWDIREFNEILLLITIMPSKELELQVFQNGNSSPTYIEGMNQSSYLDVSYDPSSKGLSVLAITRDTPQPATRVFHYLDGISPYGVLSLDDFLFYKIHRAGSHIILVGIHQLMCYNIDGSLEWSVNSPNCYVYQQAALDNNLLLYFSQARFSKANTLYIKKNGEKNLLNFPDGLTSLQPYKNELLALDKNNDIVIINKTGNIDKRYSLDIFPSKIYWTDFSPHHIYILDNNSQLYIYSVSKSNNRKDEIS